jgi:glycerol-3-phosphate dehydrogenase (NAD+)
MLLSHKRNANIMNDDFSSNPQISLGPREKVTIVGSGNWGSAIATKIGRNCERLPFFEDIVHMWVYEEWVDVEGCDGKQKLTKVINTRHENVKYLPGISLPENVVATSDLAEACHSSTLIIFVLPHQFLSKLLPTIREAAHPSCRGVSLVKGISKIF